MAASDRFVFTPRQVESPGAPVAYDVNERPGGNRRVGQVFYDGVMQRWCFITESHYTHMSTPGVEIGSSDAQSIKDFINALVIQQAVIKTNV